MTGGIDVNDQKKVTLPAVIINCICAAGWDIVFFYETVWGNGYNSSLILRFAIAFIWDIIAVNLVIKYIKSKDNDEGQNI